MQNFHIKVPENFNFAYDVVDEWARIEPHKKALLWTNDKGLEHQFTFADVKHYSDQAASFFQQLGIGHGDMVMLIMKRRYQWWWAITALHKLGAVAYPPAHAWRHRVSLQRRHHQGHRGRGRRRGHRPHRSGPAPVPVGQGVHLYRPPRAARLVRLRQGPRRGARLPPPRARQHQRRHLAHVLHQRHQRRAQDGGPRLSLPAGAHHHGQVLAQPRRALAALHPGRHGLGQSRVGQVLRAVDSGLQRVCLRLRQVQARRRA